ncbi:MAG: 3-methyl-2-oxobutanoate hydroxymethyltransferase [Planctomycetota bacterium]|nr:3-methyl-2-oxobutanoate hydroxymethyltransferase [Planctomycetota bacterium]
MTVPQVTSWKKRDEKIAMVTAYDYPTAILVDRAGIEVVLVGDSLANVILGQKGTVGVTMDEMIHHARAVRRGIERALLIGDMPFLSYQASKEEAIRNAGRFLKEAGTDAIKLEGGRTIAATVRGIVEAGIPVMGHIGLTPQSASKLGGYRVQGKDAGSAQDLIRDATALESAGVFSIVLECVPDRVSERITSAVSVPTIGIGAGPSCDGQVLVLHDLLGLTVGDSPRFVKRYADLSEEILKALRAYRADVASGTFPGREHSFTILDREFKKIPPPGIQKPKV